MEQDIKKLKDKLYLYLRKFKETFNNQNYDNNDEYFFLAGYLRVLLCETGSDSVPILLKYSELINEKLYIVKPFGEVTDEKHLVFAINNFVGKWPFFNEYETIPIDEYLDKPIGAIQDPKCKNNDLIKFTPREIIKLISNKDGVSHLQLKPHKKLEIIRNIIKNKEKKKDILIRNIIYQISIWTFHAIQYVLRNDNFEDLINRKVKELNINISSTDLSNAITKLKENQFYAAHDRAYGTKLEPFKTYIKGYSWHAIIKLNYQLGHSDYIIYNTTFDVSKNINLLLLIDSNCNLICRLEQQEKERLEVTCKQIDKCSFFNEYIYLSFQLGFLTNDQIQLELFINSNLIDRKTTTSSFKKIQTSLYVGGDINGNYKSSFFLHVFTYFDAHFRTQDLPQIEQYLWASILFNNPNNERLK